MTPGLSPFVHARPCIEDLSTILETLQVLRAAGQTSVAQNLAIPEHRSVDGYFSMGVLVLAISYCHGLVWYLTYLTRYLARSGSTTVPHFRARSNVSVHQRYRSYRSQATLYSRGISNGRLVYHNAQHRALPSTLARRSITAQHHEDRTDFVGWSYGFLSLGRNRCDFAERL